MAPCRNGESWPGHSHPRRRSAGGACHACLPMAPGTDWRARPRGVAIRRRGGSRRPPPLVVGHVSHGARGDAGCTAAAAWRPSFEPGSCRLPLDGWRAPWPAPLLPGRWWAPGMCFPARFPALALAPAFSRVHESLQYSPRGASRPWASRGQAVDRRTPRARKPSGACLLAWRASESSCRRAPSHSWAWPVTWRRGSALAGVVTGVVERRRLVPSCR